MTDQFAPEDVGLLCQGLHARMQFRVEAIVEREGSVEKAVTSSGVGISYSLATDIALALDLAAKALETLRPVPGWRELGQPDPHAGQYGSDRSALSGGHLTDDQVAHQTSMLMRDQLNHEAVLCTAKDRIRWLSRRLHEVQAPLTWRPIETAPRDGTKFLACGGGTGKVAICYWADGVGAWDFDAFMLEDWDDQAEGYSRPLKWMPLPDAATEGQANG